MDVVAGPLGGGAQGDAQLPRRACQGDRVEEAGFACGLGDIHEQAVRKSFGATVGADEVGVRRIVLGLVVHGGFSFMSRLVSARSPPGGPPELLEMPGCIPRGLPLAGCGESRSRAPRRAGRSRGATSGGPARTSRDKGARTGRRLNDTTRKSESGRTARLRRHCGNGLRRYEPMSLPGSGRTSSRPWASHVTVTVLPCTAWRAGAARSTMKRSLSETTA